MARARATTSGPRRPRRTSRSPRGRTLRPVWERGRIGRLWGGLLDHGRTAWWGLVSARIGRSRGLVVVQAVVLREAPARRASHASGEPPARQVLLSLRSDLFGWELPGGTPERGESAEAALRREVREETGLEVEIEAHVGDWQRTGFRPHLARVYRCRVVGGIAMPSPETPRLGWFDVRRPPLQLLPWYHAPLREAVAGAAAEAGARPRREHHGVAVIVRAFRIDLGLRWRGLPPMQIEPDAPGEGDDELEGQGLAEPDGAGARSSDPPPRSQRGGSSDAEV